MLSDRPGVAQRLFQFNGATPFIPYDVSSDGQRVIVAEFLEESASIPITLVVNWQDALGLGEKTR